MQIPIKRYLNRKYYNTLNKRYITLDEIGELIRSGVDINVIDAASGDDITTLTLSQVIMEQEKRGESTFSRGLLLGLIRAHKDTLDVVGHLLHLSADWSGLLSSVGIPTREDIDDISNQIDFLAQEINELSRDNNGIGEK